MFLGFEFRAKLFGQELLGFGQPNLIQCLSEGKWIGTFFCYSEWRQITPHVLAQSLGDYLMHWLMRKPVVSIQVVSIRPQALKLHKNFDHFKYSLHGHKNIWGEYSSYFKPSAWNCLHLNWINFYRNDLFRSDFALKRPLTMDACFNFVVSSRRSESEDED